MKTTSAIAVVIIGAWVAWGIFDRVNRVSVPHWPAIEDGQRVLHSPSGFQTVSQLDGGRTGLYYDSGELIGLLRPHAKKVALLGLGGGEMLRAARRTLPEAQLIGVELDPVVAELAVSAFHVDQLGVQIEVADARAWVMKQPQGSLSALMIDVYVDAELPEQFTEANFFTSCWYDLEPKGVLLMNVFPVSKADAIEANMAMFRTVERLDYGDNVVLVAIKR